MDIQQFKITKVVDANLLEQHTREGWHLVRILEEEMVIEHQRQELGQPYTSYGNSYGPCTYNCITPIKVKTCRYLLGFDEKSAHALLCGELEVAKKTITAAHATDEVRKKEFIETERKLVETKALLERTHRSNDEAGIAMSKLRELNKKLESDIAKIRTAIGEKQMKEILG